MSIFYFSFFFYTSIIGRPNILSFQKEKGEKRDIISFSSFWILMDEYSSSHFPLCFNQEVVKLLHSTYCSLVCRLWFNKSCEKPSQTSSKQRAHVLIICTLSNSLVMSYLLDAFYLMYLFNP